jgi:hypothetical protein
VEKEMKGTGTGVASVLLIVVVLAFAAFGILSLVSARADARLTDKMETRLTEYYRAESRIQERLAEWDAGLADGTAAFPESGILEITEELEGGQQLVATVRKGADDARERYEIVSWKLTHTSDWQPGGGQNVWDGGE